MLTGRYMIDYIPKMRTRCTGHMFQTQPKKLKTHDVTEINGA